jgi:hypothetical protein
MLLTFELFVVRLLFAVGLLASAKNGCTSGCFQREVRNCHDLITYQQWNSIRGSSKRSISLRSTETLPGPQRRCFQRLRGCVLIRELERQTGFRLFDRTTRQVMLTGQGSELLDITRPALRMIDEGVARIEQSSKRKTNASPLGQRHGSLRTCFHQRSGNSVNGILAWIFICSMATSAHWQNGSR